MAYATITQAQAHALIAARALPTAVRSEIKRAIFAVAKTTFGVPEHEKVRVEVDDTAHPRYLQLRSKVSDQCYALDADGRYNAATEPTAAQPTGVWYRLAPSQAMDAFREYFCDTPDDEAQDLEDCPQAAAPDDNAFTVHVDEHTSEVVVYMPD